MAGVLTRKELEALAAVLDEAKPRIRSDAAVKGVKRASSPEKGLSEALRRELQRRAGLCRQALETALDTACGFRLERIVRLKGTVTPENGLAWFVAGEEGFAAYLGFPEALPNLVTEYAQRAGAGAVVLARALVEHPPHQVEILPHG